MKSAITRLYHRFDREAIEHQIEEELRFHLELLTEQHLQQNMPLAEAQDAASKRFGNVQLIKDQCVAISRTRPPLFRALRFFLILVFLVGVLMRVFTDGLQARHLGDIFILLAISGGLFFYVRGLNPSRFTSKDESASPLMLNDGLASFTTYDQNRRTPLERVISDS
jgi:hypothetical protein